MLGYNYYEKIIYKQILQHISQAILGYIAPFFVIFRYKSWEILDHLRNINN